MTANINSFQRSELNGLAHLFLLAQRKIEHHSHSGSTLDKLCDEARKEIASGHRNNKVLLLQILDYGQRLSPAIPLIEAENRASDIEELGKFLSRFMTRDLRGPNSPLTKDFLELGGRFLLDLGEFGFAATCTTSNVENWRRTYKSAVELPRETRDRLLAPSSPIAVESIERQRFGEDMEIADVLLRRYLELGENAYQQAAANLCQQSSERSATKWRQSHWLCYRAASNDEKSSAVVKTQLKIFPPNEEMNEPLLRFELTGKTEHRSASGVGFKKGNLLYLVGRGHMAAGVKLMVFDYALEKPADRLNGLVLTNSITASDRTAPPLISRIFAVRVDHPHQDKIRENPENSMWDHIGDLPPESLKADSEYAFPDHPKEHFSRFIRAISNFNPEQIDGFPSLGYEFEELQRKIREISLRGIRI